MSRKSPEHIRAVSTKLSSEQRREAMRLQNLMREFVSAGIKIPTGKERREHATADSATLFAFDAKLEQSA